MEGFEAWNYLQSQPCCYTGHSPLVTVELHGLSYSYSFDVTTKLSHALAANVPNGLSIIIPTRSGAPGGSAPNPPTKDRPSATP